MSINNSESTCSSSVTTSEDEEKREDGDQLWKNLHKKRSSYDSTNVDDVPSNSTYDNVNIYQSKQVHVGNVTYISRPISLNQKFIISDTKNCKTKKVTISKFYDACEEYSQHEDTNYVIHIEQTIKFSKTGLRKLLADALYKFMEVCMQFIDGA